MIESRDWIFIKSRIESVATHFNDEPAKAQTTQEQETFKIFIGVSEFNCAAIPRKNVDIIPGRLDHTVKDSH